MQIFNKDLRVNNKALKTIAKRFNVEKISIDRWHINYGEIIIEHRNHAKTYYFAKCMNMTLEEMNKGLFNRIKSAINNYWEKYQCVCCRFRKKSAKKKDKIRRSISYRDFGRIYHSNYWDAPDIFRHKFRPKFMATSKRLYVR